MGRTIPSFRIASMIEEEKEWKSFRNSLDKSDRTIFDDMFAISPICITLPVLILLNMLEYSQFSYLLYLIIINNLCNSHIHTEQQIKVEENI